MHVSPSSGKSSIHISSHVSIFAMAFLSASILATLGVIPSSMSKSTSVSSLTRQEIGCP